MKLSKTLITLCLVTAYGSGASAQSAALIDLMNQAAEASPAVQIANLDIVRSEASADRLRANPYDYQVTAGVGQRFIDDPLATENRYTEFGAGVSRTIRLPNKRDIDAQLADLEIRLAALTIESAKFEERKTFIALWNVWMQADQMAVISAAQADKAKELAALEQTKVDEGAGRQIDADLSLAEAEMARLEANGDALNEQAAKLNISSRYPALDLPDSPSVTSTFGPNEPMSPAIDWAATPNYQLSILKASQLRLQAERQSLYKRPDPTLGLDITDEFGGRETSVVATISIPIGGRAKKAASQETFAYANMAEVEAKLSLEVSKREFERAVQDARLNRTALASALKAKNASLTALERLEAGYKIGDVTLPDLLKAGRSYGEAEQIYARYLGKSQAAQLLLAVYQTP